MSKLGEKAKIILDLAKTRLTALSEALRGAYIEALAIIDKAKAIIDKIKGMFMAVALALAIFAGNGHAGLFSSNKPLIENDLQLIKMQLENGVKIDKVADKLADVQVKVNSSVDLQNNMRADIQAQAQANARIAGVDNSRNTTTSAGRDSVSRVANDSAIFIKYVESQDKLAKVYEKIIIVLIGQLCALLTLFIKKDWDVQKAQTASNERETERLIKLISDDSIRDDTIHNMKGGEIQG